MKFGEKLGLQGAELKAFVLEQQEKLREERRQEREAQRALKELEAAQKQRELEAAERQKQKELEAAERQRELEAAERQREAEERQQEREAEERRDVRRSEERLRELELSSRAPSLVSSVDGREATRGGPTARAPKMPPFQDEKEDLDAYLMRFERIAALSGWERADWAGALSVLLSGRALETYASMPISDASDYDCLKEALLRRYQLTEEGYRTKFRLAKPEKGEGPGQFVSRLRHYFQRWIELSGVDLSVDGLTELFLKEQFLNSCTKELTVHLRLNDGPLSHLVRSAEIFLGAHGRSFGDSGAKGKPTGANDSVASVTTQKVKCFSCQGVGHRSNDCPRPKPEGKMKCFICAQDGHFARECKNKEPGRDVKAGGAVMDHRISPSEETDKEVLSQPRGLLGQRENSGGTRRPDDTEEEETGPIRSGSGVTPRRNKDNMPVTTGFVGAHKVQVLRDTGCSGIIVKSKFVKDDEFTGEHNYLLRIDNTIVEAKKAIIKVETPFLRGSVEALCLPDALYDLVIGNVAGVGGIEIEGQVPTEAEGVVTRAQATAAPPSAMRPPALGPNEGCVIDRQRLIELQANDADLKTPPKSRRGRRNGQAEVEVKMKDGIWYRVFSHPHVDYGKARWQVLVPEPLRGHVLRLAHESVLGGHMGVQKTTDRILLAFYWPGIHGDIRRFCRSCDVCQKTVRKGSVRKAPLGRTPVIEEPFKRVAVDLVGPIFPASEGGHKYILTLVDYATRYPEAVPLKRIDTETVAEALVGMFCRLGFPEEVLSDLGTQFVSECMTQVAKLLSIRQLTTSPYNPSCNGLVERFNSTLKTMLRRLCSEQPKLWHRFLGPLLFAYREVPQESTGFSPFELIFGRNVRGPMQILKNLWTEEKNDGSEVRGSYQYVIELRDRLESTLELAREQLKGAQEKQRKYADRGAKLRSFREGEEVLILLPTDQNKLLMQWKGPYVIADKVSSHNYKVRVRGKEKVYHVNLLKKYIRRPEAAVPEDVCRGILQVASVAVIEEGEEVEEGEIEAELLPLGSPKPEETRDDVKLAKDLPAEQRADLEKLLSKHHGTFTDRPGRCHVAEHRVDLISEQPVVSKPYAVPHSLRESLREDLEEMERAGIIRPSSSPYASPGVIVKKRDQSNRICIDYRKLNRLTKVDPEPMIPLKDVVHAMGESVYFSKLDMAKGYWQILVAEEDIPKTAFVTQYRKFESLRMPFGMVNSGATLTRCLRKVLSGMRCVTAYLDDILVHTRTWDEHVKVLDELLGRLREAGLTVKPSKCELGVREIDFLGHRLGCGQIQMQDDNAGKIEQTGRPHTKKEVRSLLGLCNFYREFIHQYATIAAPLTDLTKKGEPNRVKWTESHEHAYRSLKAALARRPILRLADLSRQFILRTDASDVGIGAALCQRFDDGIFPISYASRKLLERERRYSVMEKECLALVWAIKKFDIFLHGQEFILQTDHQPLTYLNQAKFANDRIMRWALYLQGHRFRVEAIRGRDNVAADFLSRMPNPDATEERESLGAGKANAYNEDQLFS